MSIGFTGRRVRATLLVAGLALALLGMGAPAAASPAAATAQEDCPSRSLCLYEGTGFTGEMFAVTALVPGGTCVSLVEHGWGDRAHSALNTHPRSAAMFMNDDCLGGPFQVPGGTGLPDLGSFTPESVWVPSLFD